jgi:dTDP-4-amino-4,6-dideoxygalactose transaminase
MKIPFHKPILPKNLSSIFPESIKDGWLTTGPQVKKFESSLSNYLNVKNVIAVNSCTAALHLGLSAKGFGKGDKFLAPTYTFVATIEVGEYLSMKPILIDCEEDSFNIDLNAVEHQLKTDKDVKAVIPVHFSGEPVDRKNLEFLCEKYDVFILEDAAHALEATSLNSRIELDNYAVALSFYANKNLTTGGEGGAFLSNNEKLSEKVRRLSLHGMSKDGWKRFKVASKWKYDVSEMGYKYNMTDVSASFGLEQLKHINFWHQKRIEYVNIYKEGLKTIKGIVCPDITNPIHSWHLFIIKIQLDHWQISRDEIIIKLNDMGIGTSVHYVPVHMHSYYIKKYNFTQKDFLVATKYSKMVISLPLYPALKIDEINYVIEKLNSLWIKFKV